MGPFIMHPLVARVLQLPENRLRFIVPPDIGGSYGIKTSIYPYLALIGLTAMKTGVTVKWIEDRREHLLASSSGTDRVAYRELAAQRDGTVLAMRYRWFDNVGGYVRSPEPGCSFRPLGNYVGPYRFQHLEVDASVVMTNKSLTGPNRGYACGHLYFETERMMDLLAEKLGLDPVEVRRRNLIPAGMVSLPDSDRWALRQRRLRGDSRSCARGRQVRRAEGHAGARRAREGRYVGIGIALAVDPSVSNMGYVAAALDPQFRAKPEYLPKSGAVEACAVKIDPLGRLIAVLGTTPQGQGHQTVVAQILADELGIEPADITVVDEMDTFTRVWSISSGTYSSRFGSVGTSAVALAGRKLKAKLVAYAAHLMDLPADQLELRDGAVRLKTGQGALSTPSRTWPDARTGTRSPSPRAWSRGWPPPPSLASRRPGPSTRPIASTRPTPTASSPRSWRWRWMWKRPASTILKYVTVHDAGTIINPMIAEGQIYGGALHGLGGALYEELAYDANGQCLTASFMDYVVPSAGEAPDDRDRTTSCRRRPSPRSGPRDSASPAP